MPYPYLARLVAYGPPGAVATWRKRLLSSPGLMRLSSDPVVAVKLAGVRVETFSGTASGGLAHIVKLGSENVDMIALWQDEHAVRHWVHIRRGRVTEIDVPGDALVGLVLAHGGKYRQAISNARTWPIASQAIAAADPPLTPKRSAFILFDLESVWTPATHPAPLGTTWTGGLLDVTDLALGRHLAHEGSASQFPWARWAVNALATFLNDGQVRACDVPELVAATAGLPVAQLTPLLTERTEPAGDVIAVVRALVQQRITPEQMADVLPALVA